MHQFGNGRGYRIVHQFGNGRGYLIVHQIGNCRGYRIVHQFDAQYRISEVVAVGQTLRSISSQAGLQLLNVLVILLCSRVLLSNCPFEHVYSIRYGKLLIAWCIGACVAATA